MTETPIADMVARMLSTGIPPDAIVLAVATAEQCAKQPIDPMAEKRRKWDRERKQKQRVHRNSADPPLSILPPLDSKNEESTTLRARAIDVRWKPTQDNIAFAAAHGLTPTEIESEADRFRDHWLGTGKARKDWDATWRNWIRSPYRKRNGASPDDPLERRNGESLGALGRRLYAAARDREIAAGIDPPHDASPIGESGD